MHNESWKAGPGTTEGTREVSRAERDEPLLQSLTDEVDALACKLEASLAEVDSAAAQDALRRAYASLVAASDALMGKEVA